MFNIFKYTLIEATRKKIFIIVGVISLLYLLIFGIISKAAYNDIAKNVGHLTVLVEFSSFFVSFFGIYFANMIIAFLTIMISAGSVSSEIDNFIIQSIVTRPVKRSSYIMGKFLGNAFFMVICSFLLYIAIFLTVKIVGLHGIDGIGLSSILKASLFFMLQPIAILAVSFFGNVRFKTITNGVFVIGIYILGLMGGMIEQIGVFMDNQAVYKWGILAGLISPFDSIYRLTTSTLFSKFGMVNPMMEMGNSIGSAPQPSNWMIVYIFAYIIILMYLAMRKFKKREL